MSVCMVGSENNENGLNLFFLDLKDYLPFSFVQLGMVLVHSAPCFCTFHFIFVQMLQVFVHLVKVIVHLLICTFGSICCTFGLYFCTLGYTICTIGYCLCTHGGI